MIEPSRWQALLEELRGIDRGHLAHRLTSVLAHDLANQLASISLNAGMLATGEVPASERTDLIEDITKASDGALTLIRDLQVACSCGP
jgi:signal transduction histidine kinase